MTEPREPYQAGEPAGDDLAELERLYQAGLVFLVNERGGIDASATGPTTVYPIQIAEFIVLLHNAFPALLARVRAAEAALAQARLAFEGVEEVAGCWCSEWHRENRPYPGHTEYCKQVQSAIDAIDAALKARGEG